MTQVQAAYIGSGNAGGGLLYYGGRQVICIIVI